MLERALLMSDADILERSDFEQILPGLGAHAGPTASRGARTLEQLQQDTERQAIAAAISAAGGNKAQAARSLGISRASLYEKLAALGISSSTNG